VGIKGIGKKTQHKCELQLQRCCCVTHKAGIQHIGCRISLRSQTLTCSQKAMCSPGLLLNGLRPCNPCITIHLATPMRDGRLSWPGWLTNNGHYPRSAHISTIDQAKIWESPPPKDWCPNHWATPPTF